VDEEKNLGALDSRVQELKTLSLIARANIGAAFGQQYDGDRKLNDALGWEKEPRWQTYLDQYRRGGIAKTVINIKPEDTWRGDITILALGDGEKDDEFNETIARLWRDLRLKEYFLRADKMAGIGQYSVIRLGFKEPADTKADGPVEKSSVSDLLYVTAFSQPNSEVGKLVKDEQDPKFGHVEVYQLTEQNEMNQAITGRTVRQEGVGTTRNVHADRVIHVAENLLEDEIYGTPRLECVLNHLYDLQKVTGGSAEMYWRGAFPGFAFELDPEADLDADDLDSMTEQIDDMIMNLKRYIKVQGVTVNQLSPQVVDPKGQVEVQLQQISGASRIPVRILIGSERGELASTQDGDNWSKVIQSRRETDCERWLRSFVDRLIEFEILPAVKDYMISWPSLTSEKEKENSETAFNLARAIQSYVQGDGEQVMPFDIFLTRVIGVPQDEVDGIMGRLDEVDLDDDDDDIDPGFLVGNVDSVVERAVREAASERLSLT
jgi:hypothetical protein